MSIISILCNILSYLSSIFANVPILGDIINAIGSALC